MLASKLCRGEEVDRKGVCIAFVAFLASLPGFIFGLLGFQVLSSGQQGVVANSATFMRGATDTGAVDAVVDAADTAADIASDLYWQSRTDHEAAERTRAEEHRRQQQVWLGQSSVSAEPPIDPTTVNFKRQLSAKCGTVAPSDSRTAAQSWLAQQEQQVRESEEAPPLRSRAAPPAPMQRQRSRLGR